MPNSPRNLCVIDGLQRYFIEDSAYCDGRCDRYYNSLGQIYINKTLKGGITMEEIKTNETQEKGSEETEIKPETTPPKDNGVQPETNRLIEDTNLAAKRLEDATKAAAEERAAREESYAKMKLGGRGERGQEPEAKEDNNADYAKKAMAGEL